MSLRIRLARLYVAKRRAKPIVSASGSSALRRRVTNSSGYSLRRRCSETRRRMKWTSAAFSTRWVSHSSASGTPSMRDHIVGSARCSRQSVPMYFE